MTLIAPSFPGSLSVGENPGLTQGIFGIRDLTKILCGIRENRKYLGGKRDFTATKEAEFIKILERDVGFFLSLSGIREIMTTQVHVLAANAIQQRERTVVSPINWANHMLSDLRLMIVYLKWSGRTGLTEDPPFQPDARKVHMVQ